MQSESLLNAAMAEVKMTRAKFYPSVGLSAAYEGTRTDDMAFENICDILVTNPVSQPPMF